MHLRRPQLSFAVVSLSLLISSMQFAMISVALPDVGDDLGAQLRWVGWVITAYTVMQAVSMPIAGKLSDELGRRTVFVGGVALFGVASLACALAPNIWVLIAGRSVQGLAGGSLLPSAYGIVGDAFPERRTQALGLISSVFPIGSVLGPNLGGTIVDSIGWRWTFALNVPLTIIVIVVGLLVLAPSARKESNRIDFGGAVLLALSVVSLIFAFTELGRTDGDPNPFLVGGGVLLAIVGTYALLRYENMTPSPIIEIKLLKRKEFAYLNTLNFFYGVSIFGVFSFIPLYAQNAYGMSSSETGYLLTPRAIVMIIFSTVASIILPRTGYRKPIIIGLLVLVVGMIFLAAEPHAFDLGGIHFSDFVVLATVVSIAGVGLGIAGPAANNAAIELEPERVAAITGMRGMFRSLGGAIGVSVIVLITAYTDRVEQGIEFAFIGLAVLTALTTLLTFGIPDEVGVTPQPVPRPSVPPAPARST